MKKLGIFMAIGIALVSCKNENKTEEKIPQSTELTETKNQEIQKENTPSLFGEFDWSKIPESTADIGAFPYLTAPEGFMVRKKGSLSKISANGITKFSDFSKLIMYDGKSFFDAEGKKAELSFGMKERKTDFNQYKFDKSVDNYLETIGAILLFKGQIPRENLEELKKIDNKSVYNFIQGDPWNKSPVRHYALNHKNGKTMIQVWSNTASAEFGVVELEGFKQTIKAPTASEMQKDIEAKGKAILNIHFDTDKATLKPDGEKIVDEIVILLSNDPKLKLSIEGHTDNTGTDLRNKKLSGERANTVMYTLAAKGIDIKRLKASGFGSEKPLLPNDSEENKAKNRRVELVKF